MEVSLYHRLAGVWTGADYFASRDESVGQIWAIALGLFQGLLTTAEITDWVGQWSDRRGLENALVLLPVMVFYHEDPLYLGDRLHDFPVPLDQLPVVHELAQVISACLREKFDLTTLTEWLVTHSSVGKFWDDLGQGQKTWRQWAGQIDRLGLEDNQKYLLKIYGAIAYGRGQWSQSLALVGDCAPILQIWVALLIGTLRGDRRLPIEILQSGDRVKIHHKTRQLWSQWSGLPYENQLHLDQMPLIASSQVLQYRPALRLLSQRHLV